MTRLAELEALAWRLVLHNHAEALREDRPHCVELQRLIAYFETNGAPAFDEDPAGRLVGRAHPSRLNVRVRP